jgi:hypothetical protein
VSWNPLDRYPSRGVPDVVAHGPAAPFLETLAQPNRLYWTGLWSSIECRHYTAGVLSVQILGRVRIWHADREVDAGPPARRLVLGLLALNSGRLTTRHAHTQVTSAHS